MTDIKILVILRRSILKIIRCKQTSGKSHTPIISAFITIMVIWYYDYKRLTYHLNEIWSLSTVQRFQLNEMHKKLGSFNDLLDNEVLAREQIFELNKMCDKFTSQFKKYFFNSFSYILLIFLQYLYFSENISNVKTKNFASGIAL